MADVQQRHVKVSGGSGGTGPKGPKKDGYASGRVPDTAVGTKVGKVDGKGYSGPPVAQQSRS